MDVKNELNNAIIEMDDIKSEFDDNGMYFSRSIPYIAG